MCKKILAVVLAAMMMLAFATGCKPGENENNSSKKKPTSSTESIVSMVDDVSSSTMAEVESEPEDESYGDYVSEPSNEQEESSSKSYKWTLQTKSAFFRDTSEAKESVTVSSGIKQYKNPGTYMIMAFQCRMGYCVSNGTDFASREKEYADVVRSNLFNTYFTTTGQYLLTELKYIKEAGASFWLGMGSWHSEDQTIEEYTANLRYWIDLIDKEGCLDLLNGFTFDEPIWHGQSNADFLKQTEVHYKVFGLRNFPVLATGEFSGEEGNDLGIGAEDMDQMTRAGGKYVTDIAFDSYRVDVRDGAPNNNRYQAWTELLKRPVKNGRDYYTAYKEYLLEYIGHPVNFYYYPNACLFNLVGGLNGQKYADEDYCYAQLEFMAEDVLKYEYGGGLVIFNYNNNGSYLGLRNFLDIKDENGQYIYYTDSEKWVNYTQLIKDVRKKFDSVKQTRVYVEPK